MIRYAETRVTFEEVPDEITLCVNLTGCPYSCPGCHSPWMRDRNAGEPLTLDTIDRMIHNTPGVSCIVFMGGDSEPEDVLAKSKFVHDNFNTVKTCWYSGSVAPPAAGSDGSALSYDSLDYLKIGPWIKERGPLGSPDGNQRMYMKIYGDDFWPDDSGLIFLTPDKNKWVDITYKFIKGSL